jgi:hypothetical protein
VSIIDSGHHLRAHARNIAVREFKRQAAYGVGIPSNEWATRLFKRLGFLMIDKPFKSGIYSHDLVNYGIAFGSVSHLAALSRISAVPRVGQPSFESSDIAEYFLGRHDSLG